MLLPNQNSLFTIEKIQKKINVSKRKNPDSLELVQTGVIGDGSCFIHCILHSISSEYREKEIPERMLYVQQLRDKIAEKTTLDFMKQIGKGELFRLSFIDILRQTVKEISPIPFRVWDQDIIPTIANEWKNVDTDDVITIIKNKYTLNFSLQPLFNQVCRKILEIFRVRLSHEWIDVFTIEYYALVFHRNIFVVDFSTLDKNPFVVVYPEHRSFKKCIVISWIDECHYEIVGKVIPRENEKLEQVVSPHAKIKRQFDKDDEIIAYLSTFIHS